MNIEIANRLVQLRKQNGYSQEELAAKLGLSRQAISKWERAEASPDTDNLIMLSRVYGVSVDELLRTEDPIPQPEPDKGVKVTINGKPVRFNTEDGFYFSYGDDEEEFRAEGEGGPRVQAEIEIDKHGHEGKSAWLTFPYPIFTVILYLGLGFALDLWHPGWILFLTIPVYYPIVTWLTGSRRHCFWKALPFTMIVTIAFLCLGCIWDLWHPAWALFLLIPIYYPLVKPIDRAYRSRRAKNNPIDVTSYDDDDDDDDDDD